MAKPNKTVAAAIAAERGSISSASALNEILRVASEARVLEREIADLNERLADKSASLRQIYHAKLPDLMLAAGIDHIGLPAVGNLPAMDAEMKPYYSASIAASWPDDRKAAAFKYLESLGSGDLIKTQVTAAYARGKLAEAKKVAAQLSKKKGVSVDLKQTVHTQTLTAWLKEQVEKHNKTPNLELIGGTVGRVVKLSERKDD